MTDKTPAAGWVVQLTTSATPKARAEDGRGTPVTPQTAAFNFFNVAVGSVEEAIEAARKKAGAPSDAPMRVVRALSTAEIGYLQLRAGQVKRA